MDLQLAGRTALITGGTKGIGRATARCLAEEGADVAICSRTEADVNAMVEELRGQGVRSFGRAVDVADHPALAEFVVDTATEFGGLDIIVANASAQSLTDWKAEFDTDVMATVTLVETAMPYLEQSTAPAIVAISSVSGRWIDFTAGPYGSMKAAMIHYIEGVAHEYSAKVESATAALSLTTASPAPTGRRLRSFSCSPHSRSRSVRCFSWCGG